MAVVLGYNAKMYYNSGGAAASSGWTELTNVQDVTLDQSTDEADTTTRATAGYRSITPTLKSGAVDFTQIWDTSDAGFTALQAAFENGTTIGIEVFDGDRTTAGTQGLRADMNVTNFTRNEALAEALTVSVSLRIGVSATTPEWVTVT